MGRRENGPPLLAPFFYLEIGLPLRPLFYRLPPLGISLSPRLDGLAARLKTRGVTVFTQFLSIAPRGVSAKYPSRCSSLDTCLDTVRRYGVSVASASL